MSKGIKIELHACEEWEALYIDGHCHTQEAGGAMESFLNRYDYSTPLVIKSYVRIYHEIDSPVGRRALDEGIFPDSLLGIREWEKDAKRDQLVEAEAALSKQMAAVEALRAEIDAD